MRRCVRIQYGERSKSSRTNWTKRERAMKLTRGATDDTSPAIRAEIALVAYTDERFWTYIGIAYRTAATKMSIMGMIQVRRIAGNLPFPVIFLAKASYGYLSEMVRSVLVRHKQTRDLPIPG